MTGPSIDNEIFKERFWKNVKKTSFCWIWVGAKSKKGYGQIRFSRHLFYAHRASWYLENGSIPDGLYIMHRCDNPPCVRPDHLLIGSAQDNSDDMVKKGRATFSLNQEQIIEIKRLYDNKKATQDELAESFKVSQATIWRKIHGIRGRHTIAP